jgi:vanillate/3-O-methylgallate O-demethylase
MSHESLEQVLQAAGNPVERLRNSQIGPYAFPVVRPEFTNWRDEQRAWKETCALFDQSHHMTDLYVEGPDALKLFSDLGINSYKNFKVNQAKQFVACNHNGYVIGDAILFYLDDNKFNLVGRPPAHNWVQYNLETGGYNASAERDERSAVNQGRRKVYRYQVQGPHAARDGEGDRKARAGYPVLSHGRIQRWRDTACAPCAMEWWGSPAGSCSVRGKTARQSATRL